MSTPLARCTLSADDLAAVAADYARAAERYQATVRYEPDRAVIDLCGSRTELGAFLDEMVAREGSCCSHLRLDVSETTTGYSVVLTMTGVPEQELAALRQAISVLFPEASTVASI